MAAPNVFIFTFYSDEGGISQARSSRCVLLGILYCYYRPQTKFAKVMFLQVSVILSTGEGACVVAPGGMHGCSRGHAWLLQGVDPESSR